MIVVCRYIIHSKNEIQFIFGARGLRVHVLEANVPWQWLVIDSDVVGEECDMTYLHHW